MSDLPANAGALVGERLGKYDLLALLALGGTGEIYLARIGGHAGFEKYVVVKCLHDHLADDAEFVRMFLDEARLGAQLDHSNIVQTLELGEHRGRYYMVMEYLAGMSAALIAKKSSERLRGGRFPVELVLGLAVQACSGLHYAHNRVAADGSPLEMVHRDISPQNLVVSFEGVLKLVDFGIAKAAMRETHTKSGTIKGKFAYMSPEQCLAKDVDRRTDIFALGTIVWEFLTGRRLFKRNSSYETYQAIVKGEVQPPSAVNHELDPALDRVVMRALAYRREDRYPTAEAFGEALVALLHQRGKHVSASDVARFFDQHFTYEIDEHAQRMRLLIEGRPSTLDDMTWDVDPDSDAALRMPDDVAEPLDGDPGDDEPGDGSADQGEGDADQGEATRIELNPMARFNELEASAARRPDTATAAPERRARPAGKRPDTATEISERRARAAGKRGPTAPASAGPGPTRSMRAATPPPDDDDAPTTAAAPLARSAARSPPEARPHFNAPAPDAPALRDPAAAPKAAVATGTPVPAGGPPAAPRPRRPTAPPPPPGAVPGRHRSGPSGPVAPPPGYPQAAPSAPYQAAPSAPYQAAPSAPYPAAPSAPYQAAPSAGHGAAPFSPHPSGPSAGHSFPPVQTPTAFRSRADMIRELPDRTSPGSDLALLHAEHPRPISPVLLAVAFAIAIGVGLGITLLVSALF